MIMFVPFLLAFAVGLATPSNALPEQMDCSCFEQFLDWYDEKTSDEEISPYDGPAVINANSIDPDDFENCFVLECTYSGSTRYVVFPRDAADSLMIDDDGNVLNVGSSNIVGQMLNAHGNLQYDSYFVTIYPVTSTNFASQMYSHGSYIQLTHYYQSYNSGRYNLTNSTDYVTLSNCKRYHSSSLSLRQWVYLAVAISLIFGIFCSIGSLTRR